MGKSKMDVREGGGWKKHLNYCNIYIYIIFFHNDPRQYDCDYMNRFLDYITETCDRLSDCYYIAEALPCITSCIILNQL